MAVSVGRIDDAVLTDGGAGRSSSRATVERAAPLILGVNSHAMYGSTSSAAAELALYDNLGAGWVRIDVNWNEIEVGAGTYRNLLQLDAVIRLARANRLRIVCTIVGTPSWASGGSNRWAMPRDPGDYATFLEMLAVRYGASVSGWEIWNEPDGAFLLPATPEAYMALVRVAYTRIKAVAPDAIVVSGALSRPRPTFLLECYQLGLAAHTDVVSVHTYSTPAELSRPDPLHTFGPQLEAVWRIMKANGAYGPVLWVTEFGWPAVVGGLPPVGCVAVAEQAALTSRYLELLDDMPFVGAAFVYCGVDTVEASTEAERSYGLYTAAMDPKPVVRAIQALDL